MSEEMNRRQFVQLTTRAAAFAAVAANVCGACCESAFAANAPAAPAPGGGTSSNTVDVGTVADYPSDGVYDKYRKDQVLVVRKANELYAMSAVCTHKAKTVGVSNGAIGSH